jgi:hypothetical protein
VSILVSPAEIGIDIPYWHHEAEAEEVLEQVGRYVALLQREAGLVAYDPQTGGLFEPPTGVAQAARTMEEVNRKLPGLIAHVEGEQGGER